MRHRLGATTVATVLLLAGCTGGPGMKPTITIEQANKLVEQHLHRAMHVLPGDAKFVPQQQFRDSPCDDPDDNGPRGRVSADHEYEVRGLDKDKVPDYFDALRSWWTSHGYKVLDNHRKNEFLWVESKTDAVRLTFKVTLTGRMFLIASSPCVWPNGKPPK